jgi:hypothetical protein
MANYLVRVDLFPWTAENYKSVARWMKAEGFRSYIDGTDGPNTLPAGEFVISGPLSTLEVEERACEVLRGQGVSFSVLVTQYISLRYRGEPVTPRGEPAH